MNKNYILVTIAIIFTGCIGGIDKKEASIENFTNVLNEYYAEKEHCIEMPYSSITIPSEFSINKEYLIRLSTSYEKAGLIEKKPVKVRTYFHGKVNGYEITMTKKGKKFALKKKKSSLPSPPSLSKTYSDSALYTFCIGQYQVEKITNYTTQSDNVGTVMSEVSFKLKPTKIESWVNDKTKEYINKKLKKQAIFVLTELKGWMVKKISKSTYIAPPPPLTYDMDFNGTVKIPYVYKDGAFFAHCKNVTSEDKEAVIMICDDTTETYNGLTHYQYEVSEALDNKPKLTYFFTKGKTVQTIVFQDKKGPLIYQKRKHWLLKKDKEFADNFFKSYRWVDKL